MPGLESLSGFNLDATVDEIKRYEERHGMFENQKQTGSTHLTNRDTKTKPVRLDRNDWLLKRQSQPELKQSKKEELRVALKAKKLDNKGWEDHMHVLSNHA